MYQIRSSLSTYKHTNLFPKVSIYEDNHSCTDSRIYIFVYYSTSAVELMWNMPSNVAAFCISQTVINTNASAPSSTSQSSVTITRPVGGPTNALYTVFIAAVDMAGRIGEQSDTLCFSFESMNWSPCLYFISFTYVLLTYSSSNTRCVCGWSM